MTPCLTLTLTMFYTLKTFFTTSYTMITGLPNELCTQFKNSYLYESLTWIADIAICIIRYTCKKGTDMCLATFIFAEHHLYELSQRNAQLKSIHQWLVDHPVHFFAFKVLCVAIMYIHVAKLLIWLSSTSPLHFTVQCVIGSLTNALILILVYSIVGAGIGLSLSS
jgi:hypothetical protein